MSFKCCKLPIIVKNRFISTAIGTFGIYLGIGFILPISYLAVYITSYINLKQKFVNMYYGYFLNLILTLSMTFSVSFGGLLENKIGFYFTTLLGTLIIFISNIFFFQIQNIWICYCLTLIIGIGAGISVSLLGKNLTLYFPKKKGLIVSIIGLGVILLGGGYLVLGEKIIAPGGETLGQDEEVYKPEVAERTYKYFMIGFFTIPLGDIIFLLFSHEYKETTINDIDNLVNEVENEEIKDNKENIKEDENTKNNKNEKSNILQEFGFKKYKNERIKKVLKTFRFWRIALCFFFGKFSYIIYDDYRKNIWSYYRNRRKCFTIFNGHSRYLYSSNWSYSWNNIR